MASVWCQSASGGFVQHTNILDNPSPRLPAGMENLQFIDLGRDQPGRAGLLVPLDLRVRVNGKPVAGGFSVLEHAAEILIGAQRYYFSSETRPLRVDYHPTPGSRAPTCPVCRGPIHAGDQAVCCPNCGRWYHQIDAAETTKARHCWTYSPTCRYCPHPTALDGGTVWQPESEEADVL